MRPWHFSRIKIPAVYPWPQQLPPYQASYGNWVFFYIYYQTGDRYSPFRQTYQTMTTIGLDGVE